MSILNGLAALSLSVSPALNVEPLTPAFAVVSIANDHERSDTQDDEGGYKAKYYEMKKKSKSGWGGASCKHPLNRRPYTI